MGSTNSAINQVVDENEKPKQSGCLKTVLFGKNPSCRGISIRLIHIVAIFYILFSCILIVGYIYLAFGDSQTDYTSEDPYLPTPTLTPREMDNLYQEIETETEFIRGLTFEGNVDVEALTDEQFSEDLSEGYSPENIDTGGSEQILLEVLGLLTKEQDYSQIYSDYASDAYAGYYDTDIEQIVTGDAQSTENYDLMTYSHEYTHFLQDKNFEIFDNDQWGGNFCEISRDKCAAVDALIEGDATLSGNLWLFQNGTRFEIAIFRFFDALYRVFPKQLDKLISSDSEQIPGFLIQDTSFPYSQGLYFVEHLYNNKGWSLINAAYETPPESTEQILHPTRYPNDTPKIVFSPDMNLALGREWEVSTQSTIGEWYLYLMLGSSEIPDTKLKPMLAAEATKGWGGDSLLIYKRSQTKQKVVLLRSSWDTLKDAMEFGRAFSKYGSRRWGKPEISNSRQVIWEQTDDGHVELFFLNNEVIWIITPDAELAGTLIEALPLFDN